MMVVLMRDNDKKRDISAQKETDRDKRYGARTKRQKQEEDEIREAEVAELSKKEEEAEIKAKQARERSSKNPVASVKSIKFRNNKEKEETSEISNLICSHETTSEQMSNVLLKAKLRGNVNKAIALLTWKNSKDGSEMHFAVISKEGAIGDYMVVKAETLDEGKSFQKEGDGKGSKYTSLATIIDNIVKKEALNNNNGDDLKALSAARKKVYQDIWNVHHGGTIHGNYTEKELKAIVEVGVITMAEIGRAPGAKEVIKNAIIDDSKDFRSKTANDYFTSGGAAWLRNQEREAIANELKKEVTSLEKDKADIKTVEAFKLAAEYFELVKGRGNIGEIGASDDQYESVKNAILIKVTDDLVIREKLNEKIDKIQKDIVELSSLGSESVRGHPSTPNADSLQGGDTNDDDDDVNKQNLKRSEKAHLTSVIEFNENSKGFNLQKWLMQQNPRQESLINGFIQEAKKESSKPFERKAEKIEENALINIIGESNHLTEHGKEVDSIITKLNEGKDIKDGTVIALERKQAGDNLGMTDVILLAKIIKHNETAKEEEKINLPEEIKASPIYKDALLYKRAQEISQERDINIYVVGIEGKGLEHNKESPNYHENREEYMMQALSELATSGVVSELRVLVGQSHETKIKPSEEKHEQIQDKKTETFVGRLLNKQNKGEGLSK